MIEQFKAWLNLAQVGQSRSSITNPLQWTLVILGGAILAGSKLGIRSWIIDALGVGLFVVLALLLYAYGFFMHKNPDVLRSEHFHLSKMAIERGLLGDSLHGLVEEAGKEREPLRLLEGNGQEEGHR
jgi:type IV secretory pathway TrbD component